MKQLSFYDLKTRKRFTTGKYVIKNIKGRQFAITTSPSKIKCFRILGKAK